MTTSWEVRLLGLDRLYWIAFSVSVESGIFLIISKNLSWRSVHPLQQLLQSCSERLSACFEIFTPATDKISPPN
jgi:hypothetical protein